MDKPEALRLADALEAQATWVPSGPAGVMHRAAAELRCLHDAHDWQYKMAGERLRPSVVEAQRDALLEALQDLCDTLGECGMTEKARAAIALVEGRVKEVEEGK